MFNYSDFFSHSINQLRKENRYRKFRELSRRPNSYPSVSWHESKDHQKEVVVWCSNDYLGMGQSRVVVEAMHSALDSYGAGAGGTRNISGTHRLIVELEEELADLHAKQAGLVFSSGYVANRTTLATLGKMLPDVVILSANNNHASMIDGICQSRAKKIVFRHDDPDHLEGFLKEIPKDTPKLIAFEALNSMDGNISPIAEIILLAKKYGALTFLDETHSVGVFGNRGGGIAQQEGLLDGIDIVQGGLGKGFGVVGGFITGDAQLIDVIRSYGSGFIFTTALPPVVAAGALASIRHLKVSSMERNALFDRVALVKEALEDVDIPILPTVSQIIPVMVGDALRCFQMSEMLLSDYGIYIQPINYPTVDKGTERLRVTPSPLHSIKMIKDLQQALQSAFKISSNIQSMLDEGFDRELRM